MGPVDAMTQARWELHSTLALGALPSAVPCARLHARMVMHEWALPDLAYTIELVVSELVTNALRATAYPDGGPRYENDRTGIPVVHLRLWSNRDRVVIEVWDSNPNPPLVVKPNSDDERGRGLMLVEALCERWDWGTAASWRGKVVWAELRVG